MTGDLRVSREFVTSASPEEPSFMVPEFEVVQLSHRAAKLRNPAAARGGLALACLGMAVGIGGTISTLYAFDQRPKYEIALALWFTAALLLVLSIFFFVNRLKAKRDLKDAVDDYCDELEWMVRRYGGERADKIMDRMSVGRRLEQRAKRGWGALAP